ncbi:hypothetical protein PMZ80_006116 [Knufia obscura]|uniref:Ubiquitin-like protease family profile domain-containing protein n=1 Tax=Knufia obscura TaxID=1635080 RepID=A0ABR0RNI2_9EURO|nr:hypothetical protein PMZ80_006116 [Knufia obscura]
MEWTLSKPGMAPIGQRLSPMLVAAIKPIEQVPVAHMFQAVRNCNFRWSRQAQRAPPRRRVPLPVRPQQVQEPATVVGEVVAPIVERKRRVSDQRDEEDNSMRPSKRRHLDTDIDTPWKDQAWLKEHVKDLTPPQKKSQEQIIKPRETPIVRRSLPKILAPRYNPYMRSPRRTPLQVDKSIHLYRDDPNAMEFWWSDEDEDEDLSSPPKPAPTKEQPANEPAQKDTEKVENAKDDVEKKDIAATTPSVYKEPTPPPSDTGSDWDPNEVDPEAAREYRRFLRAMPESVDEQGYKVPIEGIISPETQAWNAQHKKELELQAAATAQETPSKAPPSTSPFTPQSHSLQPRQQKTEAEQTVLSPLRKLWDGARSFFSPRSEQKLPLREVEAAIEEESPVSTPMEDVQEEDISAADSDPIKKETGSPATPSKDSETPPNSSNPEEIKEEEEDSTPQTSTEPEEEATVSTAQKKANLETPAKQLASLTLHDRAPKTPHRTPKATIHQTIKTDRKTRYQKLLEEREARRDAYPLIPLSTSWDARVRTAVQNGVKDDEGYTKYNDTDLARVVPQYSRGSLVRDNWLNDAVVNDYISLCVKHGNKDDRPTQVPSYAAFSSQTWQKIQADPKSVPSRWWKRQGIQGKRALECLKIFMPVNTGNHWTLAVMTPKDKNITIYNSMGHHRNQFVGERILAFMKTELGASLVESEWTINAKGVSPQQRNSDDCGVFSITTARQIMLGRMEGTPYESEVIPVQRKRIVAELVNGGLLSIEESKGDAKK